MRRRPSGVGEQCRRRDGRRGGGASDVQAGVRPGGVEGLDVRQAPDDDTDVTDGRELGEETLCGPEEEGTVEAVDDDVVADVDRVGPIAVIVIIVGTTGTALGSDSRAGWCALTVWRDRIERISPPAPPPGQDCQVAVRALRGAPRGGRRG